MEPVLVNGQAVKVSRRRAFAVVAQLVVSVPLKRERSAVRFRPTAQMAIEI